MNKKVKARIKSAIMGLPHGDVKKLVNHAPAYRVIDLVEEKQLDILYRVICQFIPEDMATPDEIEAIEKGRAEIAEGEFVCFEDIDWEFLY